MTRGFGGTMNLFHPLRSQPDINFAISSQSAEIPIATICRFVVLCFDFFFFFFPRNFRQIQFLVTPAWISFEKKNKNGENFRSRFDLVVAALDLGGRLLPDRARFFKSGKSSRRSTRCSEVAQVLFSLEPSCPWTLDLVSSPRAPFLLVLD